MSSNPRPLAVNFHLIERCNLRCRFCFATFRAVPGRLSLQDARALQVQLRAFGVDKLNFAGGEPTLHPHLGVLLADARRLGFTTSMVTNGARLKRLVDSQASDLDWVGLSVDSADEQTQKVLGRGLGGHVARSLVLADRARAAGIRIKLNSVITALNWDEDLSGLVRAMNPERWKAFQVISVKGQNSGVVDDLLITTEQMEAFARAHAHLAGEGLAPIVEHDTDMRGSYAMIDPLGRFFDNTTGSHTYSQPILRVGIEEAWQQVQFSQERFEGRGGLYAWSRR